jgi:3-deoxy-D-manno-octulosonic-acid transferase
MWKIVYNILLHLLLPFFLLYSLTNRKIRGNLSERLWPCTNRPDIKDAIWIHAASIGEAVIAETIVNYMRSRRGFNNFLITVNTHYSRDMLRKKFGNRVGVYSLPVDLTYSLKHFIGSSTFRALLIVETEIWPNLIWQAKKRNIPVIIVNGRISDKTSNSYRLFSFFLKNVFSDVSLVIAQSEEHARRFKSSGIDAYKVKISGNIKYYRDIDIEYNKLHKKNIITFGSIKEKELVEVLQTVDMLKRRFSFFRFFIVPRELNLVSAIENVLDSRLKTMRYSVYKKSSAETVRDIEVVVVDTVGDLLDIYKKSLAAFVGGSLAPYGGQNILEPLFFGTPVIFGPYIENFRDIADTILKGGAGFMVASREELFEKICLLIENSDLREKMGVEGRRIIEAQKEVMAMTADIIADKITA